MKHNNCNCKCGVEVNVDNSKDNCIPNNGSKGQILKKQSLATNDIAWEYPDVMTVKTPIEPSEDLYKNNNIMLYLGDEFIYNSKMFFKYGHFYICKFNEGESIYYWEEIEFPYNFSTILNGLLDRIKDLEDNNIELRNKIDVIEQKILLNQG